MKTPFYIALMPMLFFSSGFGGYAAEPAVNLLPNPGFEDGGKLPAGWTAWQGGDCCTFVWDKTDFHRGQRSLYVCNADKEGSLAWITSCKVKGDTLYGFTAWVKIIKGKNSSGIVVLRARGRTKGMDRKWEISSEAKGNTGGQWQQLKWDFKTPPGLESAEFWLWSINGRGDQVWFDDVELKEINK